MYALGKLPSYYFSFILLFSSPPPGLGCGKKNKKIPLMIQAAQRKGCMFDTRDERYIEKREIQKMHKTSILDRTERETWR